LLDRVPVFPDRKVFQVHAHHLVYPESHGKWSKIVRFVSWLRREAAVQALALKKRSRDR
jgi:LysR family glycine cleavage system transcriptional activator